VDPRDKKLVEQAREIARLQARLERAEGLIAVQKKSCADPGYPARERRERVMQTVTEMAPRLGLAPTCAAALALPRATYYRGQQPRPEPKPRPAPARALPPEEREQVLATLHEPRFVDLAPAQVYATLLDESRYLCSERTFYRILAANAEVRERRDQLRHPPS